MRFNTPAEVVAWADKAAAGDQQRARELNHDPNPYCTPGARNDWQRGYDGLGPRSWEGLTLDYDTMYQRGAAAARIAKLAP